MTTQHISWPVLICYSGEPEMMYVSSLEAWLADADLYAFDYGDDDFLIDSAGLAFQLPVTDLSSSKSQEVSRSYPLDALNERVREHLASLGHCCVSKLNLTSVSMAMQAIRDSS